MVDVVPFFYVNVDTCIMHGSYGYVIVWQKPVHKMIRGRCK